MSLYLGLRHMRIVGAGALAELGTNHVTGAAEIQRYLDRLYTKRHRPQPFVVLTDPFGRSTSPEAPYSPLSGTTVPPRKGATNTWRNNFGIQKGVGCAAEPEVIERLLDNPRGRLSCPHMAFDPNGKRRCSLRNTEYRGEDHSIWLRHDGRGYQVVDLDHLAVFRDYLKPVGYEHGIPIFPLIGMVYCMSVPGVYPDRTHAGIPDFAADFGFTLDQTYRLFDCDPESKFNSAMTMKVEDARAELPWSLGVPAGDEAEGEELPDEPPESQLNSGVGAEIIIARDLQSAGWKVRYRANQPGLGYDLEATRGGETLRVEVKSSISLADLVLQESEWRAARNFGNDYVLAVVDFYGTAERHIWYVRNPAAKADPDRRALITYRFVRGHFEPVRTEVDFL